MVDEKSRVAQVDGGVGKVAQGGRLLRCERGGEVAPGVVVAGGGETFQDALEDGTAVQCLNGVLEFFDALDENLLRLRVRGGEFDEASDAGMQADGDGVGAARFPAGVALRGFRAVRVLPVVLVFRLVGRGAGRRGGLAHADDVLHGEEEILLTHVETRSEIRDGEAAANGVGYLGGEVGHARRQGGASVRVVAGELHFAVGPRLQVGAGFLQGAAQGVRALVNDERVRIFAWRKDGVGDFQPRLRELAVGLFTGLDAGVVAVVAEDGSLGVLAQHGGVLVGEGGAEAGDGVAHVGFLMAGDDVQLAFADDDGHAGGGDGARGFVEAEEEFAFSEGGGFRRVDVFARVRVPFEHAAGETDDFASHVVDGEHEAVAEDGVAAALAGAEQIGVGEKLVVHVPGARQLGEFAEVGRRPAELPRAGDVDVEAALGEVVAGVAGGAVAAKLAVVVFAGELVGFDDAAAEPPPPFRFGVLLFLDDLDAAVVREAAQSGRVVEVLEHHEEFDGVAPDAAAEAVEALPRGVDAEGRGLFAVEGTAGFPCVARSTQLDETPDELHDVRGVLDSSDAFLGDAGHARVRGERGCEDLSRSRDTRWRCSRSAARWSRPRRAGRP